MPAFSVHDWARRDERRRSGGGAGRGEHEAARRAPAGQEAGRARREAHAGQGAGRVRREARATAVALMVPRARARGGVLGRASLGRR
jgi:hypothetical protein